MNKYHITWMQPRKLDGEIISTGKTYEADSMFEALADFGTEHPEVDEPLYIIKTNDVPASTSMTEENLENKA